MDRSCNSSYAWIGTTAPSLDRDGRAEPSQAEVNTWIDFATRQSATAEFWQGYGVYDSVRACTEYTGVEYQT